MKYEKKLIYILNHYSEDTAEHFFHVLHLLECMADKGVKIVLVIEKAEKKPQIEHKNIVVVIQKKKAKVERAIELYQICKHYINKGFKKIYIRIATSAACIAISCAKRHGAETYYWQSGDGLIYDRKKKGIAKWKWLITDYSKLIYIRNYVDHFVTGPETMIDYYIRELHVASKKMMLLYNDIDINRFSKGEMSDRDWLRDELGLPRDSLVVLSVHRLSPIRQTYRAIPYIAESEEFRRNNAYLAVIGTGPDEARIKKQVEESPYQDRILLLGAKPNQDIQKFYKGSDIFVNPSYAEGFPRVVIEAMASGLPVVVSNVGGTKDILPYEQKKYLVNKEDMKDFRDKIVELIKDESKRKILSDMNYEFVKKYSTESVADMYISAIFQGELE